MPKLPPKPDGSPLTADELLQLDLKNILKKMTAGKPLSGPEREVIKAAGYSDDTDPAVKPSIIPKRVKADKAFRLLIEKETGCSQRKAYDWLKKLRERYHTASQGWKAAEAIAEVMERQDSQRAGPDRDLKREKLALECDILRDRRDRDRALYVSKDEHRERLLAVVAACSRTIDNWIATTAAEVGNVDVKRKLEDARARAYAATQAEFGS